MSSICPACQKVIDKDIIKKTKCPYCGVFILKRTDPDTRRTILILESQILEIEKKWQDKQKNLYTNLGLLDVIYRFHFQSTFTNCNRDQLQEIDSRIIADEVHSSLTNLLGTCKDDDYERIFRICDSLASISVTLGDKQYLSYLKLARYHELLFHRKFSKYIAILPRKCGCSECVKNGIQVKTIDEELGLRTLPVVNCSADIAHPGYCHCMYIAGSYEFMQRNFLSKTM